MSNTYMCSTDLIRMLDTIYKLSPHCQTCGWKKLFICIEKCCLKSPVFCRECDWSMHLLHRTNEIRMLAINREHMKCYKEVVGKSLKSLLSFLKKQRERCEAVVKEQMDMLEIFEDNIREVEGLLNHTTETWVKGFEECVESTLSKTKPLAQVRREFQQSLKKLNFWEDIEKDLKSFNRTKMFLEMYQNNKLRDAEQAYGKNTYDKIQSLTQINSKDCVEKLFKQTCMEMYSKASLSDFCLTLTDMPDRARQTMKEKLSPSMRSSRLFIDAEASGVYQYKYGESIKIEFPFLVELHTPFEFAAFPQKQLKSLTYNLENYVKTVDKNIFSKFPPSLITLRVRLSNSNRPLIILDHLTNLKYLVVSDNILTNSDSKKLIRFAIKHNLRLLCITRKAYSKNYSKIGNWQYRFQSDQSHRYPCLRNHYLIYRRKLLQIMAIHRTSLIFSSTLSRQQILQSTQLKLQLEMQ